MDAPAQANWPAAADPAAADRLVERFAGQGAAEAKLARLPGPLAMLRALGGHSPFLSDLAVRESASVRRLVREGPAAVVATALRSVAACSPATARPTLAATLRAARRRVALATAIADIGGLWPLDQVTASLSNLADAALTAATAHLLHQAHDRGALRLPPGRRPLASGFTVLGMGKLGARELNYSSDIDLILIYDPAAHPYHSDGLGAVFSRLARDLCTLMEARDGDGYVFRTDLRLRPDPAATPPAVSLPAALDLLREHGRELGARRHDQGAPGCRRPGAGPPLPAGNPPLRVAAPPGFRRRGRYPHHAAAAWTRITTRHSRRPVRRPSESLATT